MRVVFDQRQLAHAPSRFLVRGEWKPCPEIPRRGEVLAAAAREAGHEIVEPAAHGAAPWAAVHGADYLEFLETAHARWRALPGTGPEVVPNVHPVRRAGGYPAAVVGQAGWHMADTSCPIGAGTWDAACAASDAAVHASRLVVTGKAREAYALCRPPGHHAASDMAGGFCYLNHVAIAAADALPRLAAQGRPARVAILDVDAHHGNGTQAIFYARDDVYFVSVHGDPGSFYPFFAGYAEERGAGRGTGYNLNLPLPAGVNDDAYLATLDAALEAIAAYGPSYLVVSAGLDTFGGDPLGDFALTTPGFARIGAQIAQLGLPTLFVQEGGYAIDDLGRNVVSLLGGFEEAA